MRIQPEDMASTLSCTVILENNTICCNEYNLFSRPMVRRKISNRGRKCRLDIKITNKTASQEWGRGEAAWGRLCSVLCGNGFPPCLIPAGRALPQGNTLNQTWFTTSGGSVMVWFPSSFVFPHFPCPFSVVGKGNSGYHQHPRHPSRAICQDAQGESTASFCPVFPWKSRAACGFGGLRQFVLDFCRKKVERISSPYITAM